MNLTYKFINIRKSSLVIDVFYKIDGVCLLVCLLLSFKSFSL